TAIGLAVAVPAGLGYNRVVRRNKTNMDGVRNFGSNLHTMLLRLADKTSNPSK
ncbi:MAG TPA: MotA/TolQ/ExbB proton channel family protein, partial [Burkholderiaceae bacterium]|nr:MotA/TolQ/ExbB proton channel family protein [Burkholderiaceae bacterium]